ncbi:unnamed protein product [Closterium sp. NIES-54]
MAQQLTCILSGNGLPSHERLVRRKRLFQRMPSGNKRFLEYESAAESSVRSSSQTAAVAFADRQSKQSDAGHRTMGIACVRIKFLGVPLHAINESIMRRLKLASVPSEISAVRLEIVGDQATTNGAGLRRSPSLQRPNEVESDTKRIVPRPYEFAWWSQSIGKRPTNASSGSQEWQSSGQSVTEQRSNLEQLGAAGVEGRRGAGVAEQRTECGTRQGVLAGGREVSRRASPRRGKSRRVFCFYLRHSPRAVSNPPLSVPLLCSCPSLSPHACVCLTDCEHGQTEQRSNTPEGKLVQQAAFSSNTGALRPYCLPTLQHSRGQCLKQLRGHQWLQQLGGHQWLQQLRGHQFLQQLWGHQFLQQLGSPVPASAAGRYTSSTGTSGGRGSCSIINHCSSCGCSNERVIQLSLARPSPLKCWLVGVLVFLSSGLMSHSSPFILALLVLPSFCVLLLRCPDLPPLSMSHCCPLCAGVRYCHFPPLSSCPIVVPLAGSSVLECRAR